MGNRVLVSQKSHLASKALPDLWSLSLHLSHSLLRGSLMFRPFFQLTNLYEPSHLSPLTHGRCRSLAAPHPRTLTIPNTPLHLLQFPPGNGSLFLLTPQAAWLPLSASPLRCSYLLSLYHLILNLILLWGHDFKSAWSLEHCSKKKYIYNLFFTSHPPF